MSTRSILDLSRVTDWSSIATAVKYQPPLLAEHFHVSLRTLEREFRKQLRTTPQQKMDECRQLAAEQLVRAGARTKEIAFALAYKTVPHFCRHWADFHGMGVSAWRKYLLLFAVAAGLASAFTLLCVREYQSRNGRGVPYGRNIIRPGLRGWSVCTRGRSSGSFERNWVAPVSNG